MSYKIRHQNNSFERIFHLNKIFFRENIFPIKILENGKFNCSQDLKFSNANGSFEDFLVFYIKLSMSEKNIFHSNNTTSNVCCKKMTTTRFEEGIYDIIKYHEYDDY